MSIGERFRAAQLDGRIAAAREMQGQQRGLIATLEAARNKVSADHKAERAGIRWGIWQASETIRLLQDMIDEADTQRRMLDQAKPETPPPPESLAHGTIETAGTYERQQIARVYRRLSPWAEWYRRGLISEEAAHAADRFEREFQTAGLDGLRAGNLMTTGENAANSRSHIPLASSAARAQRAVRGAVATIGGHRSLPGDLVLSCIGYGRPVKAWLAAKRDEPGRPRLNPHAAQGMLLASLEALAQHYRRAAPEPTD